MKVYTVKVSAPNDVNGNPRRGWHCYDAAGIYLGFINEEYRGTGALTVLGNAELIHLCEMPTTAGAYREARRTPYPQRGN